MGSSSEDLICSPRLEDLSTKVLRKENMSGWLELSSARYCSPSVSRVWVAESSSELAASSPTYIT